MCRQAAAFCVLTSCGTLDIDILGTGQALPHVQNPAYFLRFLDILRSPEGEPLLEQLLESEDKLAALLPPPAPGALPPARPTAQTVEGRQVRFLTK
jgi:hypothetical protein